jgi:hypothetical protein
VSPALAPAAVPRAWAGSGVGGLDRAAFTTTLCQEE